MAYILSRDHALTVSLVTTTSDKAVLLSKDGEEVNVPLVPLLGSSTLLRSVVAESHLHPGVHGPLVLSLSVAAEILVSVGEILGRGESNVKEENIEDVQQVFDLMGVEANLSQIRINNEYNEHVATNEEGVNLEIKLESMNDEENNLSESVDSEAKYNSVIDCSVNVEKLAEYGYPSQSDPNNKKGTEITGTNSTMPVINQRWHTGQKLFKCPLCPYSCSTSSRLKRHNRIHTGGKPFTCEICNSSFSQSSHLQVHKKIHTGKKPFTCRICNSSFSRPSYLQTHERIHTGEKPFECKVCSYSCSNLNALKVHKRIHTGEKPYTCKVCNISFSQSCNLRRHGRIHTGEKPYTCKVCNISFSQSCDLRTHGRIHTGEKPYTCKICSFASSNSSNLRKHYRIHTGEKA